MITEPSRQTPVYGEFDVVVVGGGPAGIMAAAAAARAGCSALLIERYGFLGGAGTAGGLSTFCGLHARTYGQDVRVIRGLADELLDRLDKLDGLNAPHLTIADGIAAQAFDISAYKIAADDLVTGSGARILFHAMAVGAVLAPSGGLDAVLIESKSGRQAVRGRFFIDASGDGDLAAWAGVPWEKAPPIDGMMYPSLMFRINGVDTSRAGPAPWRTVERLMEEAEAAGTHTFPRKKPIVRPQRNPLEWRANLTQLRRADGGAIDGTDVDELTRGELIGRQQALDAFTFIRDRTPGFEDSYIVDIAPQIGIRETRRIVGAVPADRGGRARLRRLRRHHRGERVAGGVARGRHRRVPLATAGARLQHAPVPHHRARPPARSQHWRAAGREPVRGRAVRLDDARRAVGGAGHRPVLRDGRGGRDRGGDGAVRGCAWGRDRRSRAAAAAGGRRRVPRAERA